MKSNLTSVRFLLGGSLFFNVIMDRDDATKLIRNYRDRKLGAFVSDTEGTWAVRAESLHAIHLEDIPLAPAQTSLPNPGTSLLSGPRV